MTIMLENANHIASEIGYIEFSTSIVASLYYHTGGFNKLVDQTMDQRHLLSLLHTKLMS